MSPDQYKSHQPVLPPIKKPYNPAAALSKTTTPPSDEPYDPAAALTDVSASPSEEPYDPSAALPDTSKTELTDAAIAVSLMKVMPYHPCVFVAESRAATKPCINILSHSWIKGIFSFVNTKTCFFLHKRKAYNNKHP